MKKILFCMCGWVLGFLAQAQSLDYLTFRMVDGSEVSLLADGLKITFEGSNIHAVAQEQKADFNLADMGMMFFSMNPTAIEKVEPWRDEVSIVNGRLVVPEHLSDGGVVYGMDGRRIESSNIPKGVYLVKVNGRIYKVMAR